MKSKFFISTQSTNFTEVPIDLFDKWVDKMNELFHPCERKCYESDEILCFEAECNKRYILLLVLKGDDWQ